jgi:acyl dehydratase
MARYAEDYRSGDIFDVGEHLFNDEEIIEFSKVWDPHPFHTDPDAARSSMFGGLIASGWHVALIMMRMMHQGGFLSPETSMGSPGLDELRWQAPVRPGDRLVGQIEVIDSRVSRSRPQLGLVQNRATLRNQERADVCVIRSTALVKARGGSLTSSVL